MAVVKSRIRIVVFFAFVVLVVSCSSGSGNFKEVDIFEEFPKPIAIIPDEKYRLQLGDPIEYLLIDSLLFTLELSQDNFIRCVNLNTQKEIDFFLSKGRGRGELLHCLSMRTYGGDSIQVYGEPRTIMQFAISDVLDGIQASDYRTFSIGDGLLVRPNALRLDENTILAPGTLATQESEKRFYTYDLRTREHHVFGEYNPSFFKDMNLKPTSKDLINQSFIQLHPDGNRFVAATPTFKSIEIYDLKSEQMVASRYYELPKAEIQKIGDYTAVFSSDEQNGFGEIHCTERAIYCFYRKLQDKGLNKPLYVFVYDWQLRPVSCYTMSACYTSGFVTGDDRYIYAPIIDPETEEYILCRYEI